MQSHLLRRRKIQLLSEKNEPMREVAVPYARAGQLLHDLLGVQLSAGSIATFVTTCHQNLAEVKNDLKEALVKAAVLHQDETGMRVGNEGWWVHACATDRLTHALEPLLKTYACLCLC